MQGIDNTIGDARLGVLAIDADNITLPGDQGVGVVEVFVDQYSACSWCPLHQNLTISHLYTFPPHQLASKGLVAQLVEHHTMCGFDPHSSPEIFFSQKENLGTCIQVLQ